MTIYLNVLSIFNLRSRDFLSVSNKINSLLFQKYDSPPLNTCFDSGWYIGQEWLSNNDFKFYLLLVYLLFFLPISLVARKADIWCHL